MPISNLTMKEIPVYIQWMIDVAFLCFIIKHRRWDFLGDLLYWLHWRVDYVNLSRMINHKIAWLLGHFSLLTDHGKFDKILE